MCNGSIRLCSMVFCWAAISACHALLSSHMTNKDDDDDDECQVTRCCLETRKCGLGLDLGLMHVTTSALYSLVSSPRFHAISIITIFSYILLLLSKWT